MYPKPINIRASVRLWLRSWVVTFRTVTIMKRSCRDGRHLTARLIWGFAHHEMPTTRLNTCWCNRRSPLETLPEWTP